MLYMNVREIHKNASARSYARHNYIRQESCVLAIGKAERLEDNAAVAKPLYCIDNATPARQHWDKPYHGFNSTQNKNSISHHALNRRTQMGFLAGS